jgi:hypothetical protein
MGPKSTNNALIEEGTQESTSSDRAEMAMNPKPELHGMPVSVAKGQEDTPRGLRGEALSSPWGFWPPEVWK